MTAKRKVEVFNARCTACDKVASLGKDWPARRAKSMCLTCTTSE